MKDKHIEWNDTTHNRNCKKQKLGRKQVEQHEFDVLKHLSNFLTISEGLTLCRPNVIRSGGYFNKICHEIYW